MRLPVVHIAALLGAGSGERGNIRFHAKITLAQCVTGLREDRILRGNDGMTVAVPSLSSILLGRSETMHLEAGYTSADPIDRSGTAAGSHASRET